MKRISWHEYFMGQAKIIALRSSCSRLSVGCLIVRDRRSIAGGYNGSVSGDVHCLDDGCRIDNGHCVRCVHAEANAIVQCAKFGASTEGTDIYVTHFPCLNCAKLIIQAGIRHVYYEQDYRIDPYCMELFNLVGVKVTKITCNLSDYLKLTDSNL
ncbi:ComE operon protein 2 [Desulfofarcimen acetoxidans DSM 771]|uniref:ComE operon protein 2 n=1 Tax=Desulfofarcimen acetoxidans (strain ATCC 49208 / DSM 771 / KCTC 5769 / VKM B-1644 / 5575) TaxID=485916 RepID=C8VZ99_DESAS|nr:ComE operon protein 2 [Desulfofarcimen acetoxidans]ACV64844.1 ComE operon protein 2 [Desulfofarcimen acetoxidans DSM 771]